LIDNGLARQSYLSERRFWTLHSAASVPKAGQLPVNMWSAVSIASARSELELSGT
jgi:hypothetical protein